MVSKTQVLFVNTCGAGKIAMHLPDKELLNRLRFVFDMQDTLLWIDNIL
jgi:hypothetical protein